MAESNGEKSQEPTQHRRQQAREQGQIARSQDLGSALLLVIGVSLLLTMGGALLQFIMNYIKSQLGGEAWLTVDQNTIISHWMGVGAEAAKYLVPIMGLLFITAVVVNVFQVGFLLLPEKLMPDISRLDLLKGFGRIFSLSNIVHLVFGIFKIILIVAVAYTVLHSQINKILSSSDLSVPQIAMLLSEIILWTSLKIACALLLLALFDYGFQWWKTEQDMRMTQQEVREEMKNLEGNPQVISRRKQVQRQLAMNRMSTAIPKADVVVTNPTELAVAIQYDPETMAAPIVVAKGAGTVAQRIRKMALEHGIPIIEKKPLAQALYRDVELNHPIPEDKYAAVAEVLAYVYQLKGKTIPDATKRAAA